MSKRKEFKNIQRYQKQGKKFNLVIKPGFRLFSVYESYNMGTEFYSKT